MIHFTRGLLESSPYQTYFHLPIPISYEKIHTYINTPLPPLPQSSIFIFFYSPSCRPEEPASNSPILSLIK